MQILDVEGVLFDCDGVLADSLESAARAWDRWAATWAPDYDFRTQAVHGQRAEETIATLVPADKVETASKALEAAEIEEAPGTQNIPGASALTHVLATHSPSPAWGVVTSGTRPLATARLDSADIALPPILITGDDVSAGKPDPEPYRRGAEALGVDPHRSVVFEDAPAGIESARAAGIGLVVGVGEKSRVANPDFVIDDFTQVTLDEQGRLVLGATG